MNADLGISVQGLGAGKKYNMLEAAERSTAVRPRGNSMSGNPWHLPSARPICDPNRLLPSPRIFEHARRSRHLLRR